MHLERKCYSTAINRKPASHAMSRGDISKYTGDYLKALYCVFDFILSTIPMTDMGLCTDLRELWCPSHLFGAPIPFPGMLQQRESHCSQVSPAYSPREGPARDEPLLTMVTAIVPLKVTVFPPSPEFEMWLFSPFSISQFEVGVWKRMCAFNAVRFFFFSLPKSCH